MPANQPFDPIRLACAQGGEDGMMLPLRGGEDVVRPAAKEVAADAVPVAEQAGGDFMQPGHARGLAHGEMKIDIEGGPFFDVVPLLRGVHFRDQIAQVVRQSLRSMGGDAPGGDRLDAFEQRKYLGDVFRGDRRDRRAGVGADLDQALGLERLQRLAHWDDAQARLPGHVLDDEPLAGRERAAQDAPFQGMIDGLLLGERLFNRQRD
jgi:hypothetical protein